jgi:7-cyano-7-deazaguanine synthase
MSSAVAIVSGGMDSITLAYYMKAQGIDEVHGLGFNYGQRHKKELSFPTLHDAIDSFEIVDLHDVQRLISKSVLTDHTRDVPDGHYAEDTMKQTVVPNRNMIMLSIAVGYAVTLQAEEGVWTGVHAGDHFVYPDCRPGFIVSAENAAWNGNEGFINWNGAAIKAPFVQLGKHDIAELGGKYGVAYSNTWSCYKGGEIHCGRCGTCVERKEAFRLSLVVDPTVYEDASFEIEAYRG